VWNLDEQFKRILSPTDWTVTKEDDIEMGDDWVPSPDIAILRGGRELHKTDMLRAADVALVIEVSEHTYTRDRGWKLTRYAHNRIPIYWIVHLARRTIEVFSSPVGYGDLATYAGPSYVFAEGDEVPVVLDGVEVHRFPVSDLLP
jgi:hypothetical protein